MTNKPNPARPIASPYVWGDSPYDTGRENGPFIDDCALCAGTLIATLDGVLPVEHLFTGDHVITRRGAQVLRAITPLTLPKSAPLVWIDQDPRGQAIEAPVALLPAQMVFCPHQGVLRAASDLAPMRQNQDAALRFFALHFDQDEILYANGLMVTSAAPLPQAHTQEAEPLRRADRA